MQSTAAVKFHRDQRCCYALSLLPKSKNEYKSKSVTFFKSSILLARKQSLRSNDHLLCHEKLLITHTTRDFSIYMFTPHGCTIAHSDVLSHGEYNQKHLSQKQNVEVDNFL